MTQPCPEIIDARKSFLAYEYNDTINHCAAVFVNRDHTSDDAAHARLLVAMAAYNLKNYNLALEYLTEAIQGLSVNPENELFVKTAYHLRAELYRDKLPNIKLAFDDFTKLIDLHPGVKYFKEQAAQLESQIKNKVGYIHSVKQPTSIYTTSTPVRPTLFQPCSPAARRHEINQLSHPPSLIY